METLHCGQSAVLANMQINIAIISANPTFLR